MPVAAALKSLLPEGLRPGTITTVASSIGQGSTSLALALAAEASATGASTAIVGFPALGLGTVAELGFALDHLVLVATPAQPQLWATAVATLIAAFDIVLLDGRDIRPGSTAARRLLARSREHSTVLIQAGKSWPDQPDYALTVTEAAWEGLGPGHGYLRRRRATVEATGRRGATQTRRTVLWLPGPDGTVTPATSVIPVTPSIAPRTRGNRWAKRPPIASSS